MPHDPTAVCITGSRSNVQIQSSPGDSTGSNSSFCVGDNSSNQAKGLDGSDGASVDETTNSTDHLAEVVMISGVGMKFCQGGLELR